jgi:dynein assembly factor 1
MENLKILYLHGNPVCKNINNYRKKIIYLLKKLTFLDDRPITEEERIYATVIQIMKAFFNGGREAEKAARLA